MYASKIKFVAVFAYFIKRIYLLIKIILHSFSFPILKSGNDQFLKFDLSEIETKRAMQQFQSGFYLQSSNFLQLATKLCKMQMEDMRCNKETITPLLLS